MPTDTIALQRRALPIILAILGLLLLAPLLQDSLGLQILKDVAFTAILVSTVYAVSHRGYQGVIAMALAVPTLILLWARHFPGFPSITVLGDVSGACLIGYIVIIFLTAILHTRQVTREVIYAAVAVYLLIAFCWYFLFLIVDGLIPGSFSVDTNDYDDKRMGFVYFSFVTITTLGYGDITPLKPMARSLVMIEAVLGQVYLTVLIAWLVGMHISQKTTLDSK